MKDIYYRSLYTTGNVIFLLYIPQLYINIYVSKLMYKICQIVHDITGIYVIFLS